MLNETVVLIPAYKPDHRLPTYVRDLLDAGIGKVLVVDDGGGADFDEIFHSIEAMDNAEVIRYTPNHGKGYAMKTGFKYMMKNYHGMKLAITADADGQHQVKDMLRMVDEQEQYGDGVLLGSRDFDLPIVPDTSRKGNKITAAVFHTMYGPKVNDTQTGLRAFSWDLLPMMAKVKGNRYEYEMKVLIECAQKKIPIREMKIETIYENNNECSHFHKVKDSARIYGILFGSFIKFMAGSLLSFGVDYLIFWILNAVFEKNCPGLNAEMYIFFPFVKRILLATVIARLCSGAFNYFFNKKITFRAKKAGKSSIWRYLVVFFGCMIISASLVSGLHIWTKVDEKIWKIPVDLLIFLVNYQVQNRWVFKPRKTTPETKANKGKK